MATHDTIPPEQCGVKRSTVSISTTTHRDVTLLANRHDLSIDEAIQFSVAYTRDHHTPTGVLGFVNELAHLNLETQILIKNVELLILGNSKIVQCIKMIEEGGYQATIAAAVGASTSQNLNPTIS